MSQVRAAFGTGLSDTTPLQASQDALRLPDSLPDPGLLVGWSLEADHKRQPLGFGFGEHDKTPATGWVDPILLSGEGHLITIAPTGSGKGRSCIIPSLLRHEGPMIVIDPKGENAAVTSRRRREIGQQVVVLDPFGNSGQQCGSFNPIDLIDPEAADSVDIAAMFASALINGREDARNAYWYQRAQQLLIGLILHTATLDDRAQRTFETVRTMLAQLVGGQANTASLDPRQIEGQRLRDEILNSPHPEARLAASILQSSAQEGLGSILSMTQDGVDFLRGALVQQSTAQTSFDLDAVTRGDPLSIYLVLPPHMMESHGRLLRLWIIGLLALITRRRGRPSKSTLLVLDEAAQLGELPQLRQAITLLRGYGVQTWSLWQDASQLQHLYPSDWQTMVNNCAVVQAFGALNLLGASSMEQLTGFGSGDGRAMLALEGHQMILQIAGDEAVVARKPDYLTDPAFVGQFDPNPFHDPDQAIIPPPPPRIALRPRGAPAPEEAEIDNRGDREAVDLDQLDAWMRRRNRERGEEHLIRRAHALRKKLLQKWEVEE